ERVAEQKAPVSGIKIAAVILLGVLQKLRRYADSACAVEALWAVDALEGGRFRTQVGKRLGKNRGEIHASADAASAHRVAVPHTRCRASGAPTPGKLRLICAGAGRAEPACARDRA